MNRLLAALRPPLVLTSEMEFSAVMERQIAEALAVRKQLRQQGYVRPYRRHG